MDKRGDKDKGDKMREKDMKLHQFLHETESLIHTISWIMPKKV